MSTFAIRYVACIAATVVGFSGCGGGGGGSTQAATQTPTPIQADACSPVIQNLVIPASYAGVFSIPTPSQKLPANVIRGIGLKDYYPFDPTGKIGACNNANLVGTSEAHAAYTSTLDRLKADGVQVVWVYNYGVFDDFSKPLYNIIPSTLQISNAEMSFLVLEAAKRNLKVYVAWQILPQDAKGNWLPVATPIPANTLSTLVASYKQWILQYAAFSQSIGVSGMAADWSAYYVANDPLYSQQYMTAMLDIVKSIRAVFSGKITYGDSGQLIDSRFVGFVDFLKIGLASPYPAPTLQANQNLSVGMMVPIYLNTIANYLPFGPVNIPAIFDLLVESKYDFFVNGWTEDGFCVSNCIQNTYTTDFSVQAIGIEASLEAVGNQTTFQTAGVNIGTGYWLSDTMVPVNDNLTANTGFPNLSESVRNKPAENIIKYWYGP